MRSPYQLNENSRLKFVERTERQGKRVYLRLRCGHLVLHNPRVEVPRRALCLECNP